MKSVAVTWNEAGGRRSGSRYNRRRRRASSTAFERTRDESRLQATGGSRAQIRRMRSNHHDFGWPKTKQFRGTEIDFPIRLEMTEEIGAEDGVPRQASKLRHFDEQRHVAVRKRRNDVIPLQARESLHRVWPAVEAMPHSVPAFLLLAGEVANVEFLQQFVKDHAVEIIKLPPRQLAHTNFVH